MKKLLLAMIIAAVLSAAPAFAGFINGGFEDGNFGNWTKDGGSYSGSGTYSYTGDPGKSAIVTQGKDYYSAGTTLPTGTWKDGISGWKYSDWQVVDLDTSAVKGHDLMLTLLASDCAAGGHGGGSYLYGVWAAPP